MIFLATAALGVVGLAPEAQADCFSAAARILRSPDQESSQNFPFDPEAIFLNVPKKKFVRYRPALANDPGYLAAVRAYRASTLEVVISPSNSSAGHASLRIGEYFFDMNGATLAWERPFVFERMSGIGMTSFVFVVDAQTVQTAGTWAKHLVQSSREHNLPPYHFDSSPLDLVPAGSGFRFEPILDTFVPPDVHREFVVNNLPVNFVRLEGFLQSPLGVRWPINSSGQVPSLNCSTFVGYVLEHLGFGSAYRGIAWPRGLSRALQESLGTSRGPNFWVDLDSMRP